MITAKRAARNQIDLPDQLPSESVVNYLSQMSDSLARLARTSEMTMLAYLLDLAKLEADSIKQSSALEQKQK